MKDTLIIIEIQMSTRSKYLHKTSKVQLLLKLKINKLLKMTVLQLLDLVII
jgi:hypothetical protein